MHIPTAEQSLTILNEAPFGVAVLDEQGRLSWCNAALAGLAGRPRAELGGLEERTLLATEPVDGCVQFADGGRSALRREQPLDGGWRVVYYQDRTEQEALRSERDALERQLQQHNTIDPVSGLLNQRATLNGLEPLVSRSRRYENPLSVVTMAFTNLPALREAHGDEAADQAVLAVSQLLRDQIRWADLVGRLDDGNFIFVLPETDQAAAEALAEKIARQLGDFRLPGLGVSAEGSFGVASWRRSDDARLLVQRAGEALSRAVEAGLFRVIAA